MDKAEVYAAIGRLRRYTWPQSLGNDVLTVIEAYERLGVGSTTDVDTTRCAECERRKRQRAMAQAKWRKNSAAAKSL